MRTEQEIIQALSYATGDEDRVCDERYEDCNDCPKNDICYFPGIAEHALALIAAKDAQIADLRTRCAELEAKLRNGT